ncbi:MAG TPA: amino acid ABC transporter permease [Dermatophilaceae bacterium]|nr:amino acid ABC transporter permease [Dermatophilaceae bacterium]
MSTPSVLYDAPGPRARRRAAIGGGIATVVGLILLGLVVKRLADQDQFSGELWGPILDPSNENFPLVWNLLGKGILATLTAAVLAIFFSLLIGSAVGVARMMLGRNARMPLVALIELLRGLPVVITIYFASRVLPELGVDLSGLPGEAGLWFLVIGLTAYNCVIIAEILRAGVASLPKGQQEAALAIGLTPWATMRLVLLPQATRVMLPALISQLVVILKDTSLAAVLALYIELLRQGNLIALNLHNPIQVLSVVAVIFILINYSLSRLATWVDQRSVRRTQPPKNVKPVPAVVG